MVRRLLHGVLVELTPPLTDHGLDLTGVLLVLPRVGLACRILPSVYFQRMSNGIHIASFKSQFVTIFFVCLCGGVEWWVLHALIIALRQTRDHSRQHTAATRFYFWRPTSIKTTDKHSQTYTVSAGRKESKQTVQSVRSFKQPNQQNLCFVDPLQLQISLELHNQLNQIRYQIKA